MTYVAPIDPKKTHAAGYLLPLSLRNFVRHRETGVVAVAFTIGLLSGLLVAVISKLSDVAHAMLFDIPLDAHLSSTGVISWQRTLLIPIISGIMAVKMPATKAKAAKKFKGVRRER
jgi:chloride channel protein, CIC family